MRKSLSEDREAVRAVAEAIAGIVAKKTVADDPSLARLDGLGRVMAANTLAKGMWGALVEESRAAILAVEAVLEGRDASRAA